MFNKKSLLVIIGIIILFAIGLVGFFIFSAPYGDGLEKTMDAGDVEDFIEFLFGLGISPTGNYDYMDAIEELGEEIRNETGDFALENIMTNFSALYLRFFDSECTQEEMEHVLEAIIVIIKSYTGLYVTEVDKVIVPTFLAFQKEFVKKSKTRKGAKA